MIRSRRDFSREMAEGLEAGLLGRAGSSSESNKGRQTGMLIYCAVLGSLNSGQYGFNVSCSCY